MENNLSLHGQVLNTEDFRYQVYSLKSDGSVNKPLTTPFERRDLALEAPEGMYNF